MTTQKDAVEKAATGYLQDRYGMDPDMAGLWARAMQYENAEMGEGLKANVDKARAAYQETLLPKNDESEPSTLRPEQIEAAKSPENPEEIKTLKSYLENPDHLMAEKDTVAGLIQSIESKQISPETRSTLEMMTEDLFFMSATSDKFPVVQFIINTLGKRQDGKGLIDLEEITEETLVTMIDEGDLTNAKKLTQMIYECKAKGYRGRDYNEKLKELKNFATALWNGLKVCLKNNDTAGIEDYLAAAKQYGIPVGRITKGTRYETVGPEIIDDLPIGSA